MNLKDERRDADALGPLLWDPLFEADARAQAKKSVGLIEAVGYSQHLEGAFDDEMRVVGELKADGVMKAIYRRAAGPGVYLILDGASFDDVRERMEDLPSVTEDLMTLDYEAIYEI